LRGSVV